MFLISFLLTGCGRNDAVYDAFEASKSAALAKPSAAPPGFTPDVRVQLSAALLDGLVQEGLKDQGTFSGKVDTPVVKLNPRATATSVSLSASKRCEQCFAVDLDLEGDINWSAGLLGKGQVPYSASVAFDIEVETQKKGATWTIFAKPRDLRSARVAVNGWNQAVSNIAEEPLKQWLDDEVVSRIKPLKITTLGNADLPLLGLTLRPQGAALNIDVLTNTPTPGALKPAPRPPPRGFALWVHPDSLIGFAKAEMFRAGPQAWDIVPEPRSLSVKDNTFTLGLRLWRVSGAGWWRDYSATGTLGVKGKSIELSATGVAEEGASEGAELADPLVYLGEGLVLDEMEKAMQLTLPRVERTAGAGKIAKAKINTIKGQMGALRIGGELDLHGKVQGVGGGKRKLKAPRR